MTWQVSHTLWLALVMLPGFLSVWLFRYFFWRLFSWFLGLLRRLVR